MILRGHYVGLPIADLENARSQLFTALELARKGQRFNEVDMGGKMGKKTLMTYVEIVHELKEVEHALKKALPDVYGRPVRRLIPNFNPSLVSMYCQPVGGKIKYLAEELFVDTGAVASDPKEGAIIAQRIDDPDMTMVGDQRIRYQATNSKGDIVEGVRNITIVGRIMVVDVRKIYDNVMDGEYFYERGISTINLTNGYFVDREQTAQFVKEDGRWAIYDYSGVRQDIQKNESQTPLSRESEWGHIKVFNNDI